MSAKYYAVQAGHVPGIYDTWEACQGQIKGYKGAVYKSFKTFEEAQEFLTKDGYDKKVPENVRIPDTAYAFVDGSYNPSTGCAGYGGFLVLPENKDGARDEIIIKGTVENAEFAKQRNVSGEISGAYDAVKRAVSKGLSEITLFYDYEGIEKWPTGQWAANNEYTKRYADGMKELMTVINVTFYHTKGHTGIPGNERADKLAKAAVCVGKSSDIDDAVDTEREALINESCE